MSVIFGPGIGQPPAQGSLVNDTNAADKSPVVVQATDTQTGNLLEFRDPSGNLLSAVDVNGAIGGGAGLAGAVILAPATSARNVIQPTADTATGLTIKGHSVTQSVPIASLQGSAGTSLLEVFEPNTGVFHSVVIAAGDRGDEALSVLGGKGNLPAGHNAAPAFHCASRGSAGAETSDMNICLSGGIGTPLASDGGWAMHLGATDTGNLVRVGGCFPSFANAGNEATYTTRWQWQLWDSGGAWLEPMQFATNGAAPLIGFLGAPAVVRQTNGTAAQLAAITDANAKAFLTALSTAVVNLGLLNAPA